MAKAAKLVRGEAWHGPGRPTQLPSLPQGLQELPGEDHREYSLAGCRSCGFLGRSREASERRGSGLRRESVGAAGGQGDCAPLAWSPACRVGQPEVPWPGWTGAPSGCWLQRDSQAPAQVDWAPGRGVLRNHQRLGAPGSIRESGGPWREWPVCDPSGVRAACSPASQETPVHQCPLNSAPSSVGGRDGGSGRCYVSTLLELPVLAFR